MSEKDPKLSEASGVGARSDSEHKAKPPGGSAAGAGALSCGVDADGVLRQLGQAGRFHLRVYALVALAAVQVGLLHTTYIFLAADVPYR